MSAMAAVAEVHFDEEILIPPRFTVDGKPEIVARETRRNLRNAIEDLTDDDIKQIADSAEAHKQSGQRIFLEVAYGEPVGKTDSVLHFKKTGEGITAAYTFYKDEEEGRDKRLLRELRRLEYLEKVVMKQLEMTDRTNSIGAVQGMIRSGSAFIKSLQNVFKQVETLANTIERGLQNKNAMPSAEQKTAAIQSIQAELGKLQPLSTTHLTIKNVVQQQVDQLLKNVATPVAALRSDVKASTAPLPAVNAGNNARNNVTSAQPVTASVAAPKTAPSSPGQATSQTTLQPALRSPAQNGLQAKTQETARPVTSTRFSVLTTLNVTERATHAIPQTAINNATVVATSRLAPSSVQQADARVAIARVPTALRLVAANPEVQRTAALITRSSVTVIDSKAGQQVLNTLARINPAQPVAAQPVAAQPVAAQPVAAQPVAAQPVAAQPVAAQPVAAQPVAAQPVAAQPVAAQPVAAQPVAAQPVSAQPVAAQPVAAQPVAAQPVAKIQQVAATQPTVTQPLAQTAQGEQARTTVTTTSVLQQAQPEARETIATTVQSRAETPPRTEIRQDNALPAEAKVTALPSKDTSVQQLDKGQTETQRLPQRVEPKDPEQKQDAKVLPVAQPQKVEDKQEKGKDDIKKAFKENKEGMCPGCQLGGNCAMCKVGTANLNGTTTTSVVAKIGSPEDKVNGKKKLALNIDQCTGCSGCGTAGAKCGGAAVVPVTVSATKISSRADALRRMSPAATAQPTAP